MCYSIAIICSRKFSHIFRTKHLEPPAMRIKLQTNSNQLHPNKSFAEIMTWYNVNLHQTSYKIFHVRYKACLSELLVDAEVICACMCKCHLRASVEVTRVSELDVLAEVTYACMQRSRTRGVLYACTQGSVARSGRSKSCECSQKSLTQVHTRRWNLDVHT